MANRILALPRFLLLAVTLALATLGIAQTPKVTWSATVETQDARPGEIAIVVATGKVIPKWHIYSIEKEKVPIGVPTTFSFVDDKVMIESPIATPEVHMLKDPVDKKDVETYSGDATFRLPVRVPKDAKGPLKLVLNIRSQACDDSQCDRPVVSPVQIEIPVTAGEVRPDRAKAPEFTPPTPTPAGTEKPATGGVDNFAEKIKQAQDGGIFSFILFAMTGGLLALLTPCVFPMIPITVNFFSKKTNEGGKVSMRGPLAYCAGIIGTFTLIGVGVTAIFGATGVNRLANDPYVNLSLAVIFIALAVSLFGVFEIGIPTPILNRLNQKARTSDSLAGPLLMGLVFSLTSFTCSVPFVGTVLLNAAKGNFFYPIVGMLAFSSVFALPFFLLALFPQYLAKLPKSGGWLSTVKATMGFLELAFAVKFLSAADLSWSLGWITKPVFLGIWVAIMATAGLYLLGWMQFPKEGGAKITWVRRGFGLVCFAGAVICLRAMNGGSLGSLEAFPPPDPYPGLAKAGNQVVVDDINWASDYKLALDQAKKEGKNVFIDFTGVNCINCRAMERQVFPLKAVNERMKGYVCVRLFTDRGGKDDDNAKLQQELTNSSTLPVYAVVTPEGKVLRVHQPQPPLNGDDNVNKFVEVLQSGLPASK
jgi:thiol:disulfide interchange protein DsbD